MTREEFLAGIAALRREIKDVEHRQRRDKRITRMTRKTAEDRKAVSAAIAVRERGEKYPTREVDIVQGQLTCRKAWATALYVTYNLVRGKSVAQRVDRLSQCEHWGYPRYLRDARKVFDDAVASVGVPV